MARRNTIPPEQWRDPRQLRGLRGEQQAIAFLSASGWKLEAHRFKVGRHDVDLVMRRGRLVAFVEVKTRTSTTFGTGREAVGWRKRRTLMQLGEVWRQRHGLPDDLYRFDVVEVVDSPSGSPAITHVPDAWRW